MTDLTALPHITCVTVTYNRPKLLANLIECFNRQNYPLAKRELIILDDIGQYPTQPSGEGWQVISVPRRFESLSAKRNALASITSNHTDAIAIWDDDDTFLPWTLLSHAWALSQGPVSHPSFVMNETGDGLKIKRTNQSSYQATQAIDRDLFLDVGGFPRHPHKDSGSDQELIRILRQKLGKSKEDPKPFIDPTDQFPPWFVYGWDSTGSPHLSALGKSGYEGKKLVETGTKGSQDQQSGIIPKLDRSWHQQAKEFLGIPYDLGDFDLPEWWADNRDRITSV